MVELVDAAMIGIDDCTISLDEYGDRLYDIRYCIIEEFIYGEPYGDVYNGLKVIIRELAEKQLEELEESIDDLVALSSLYNSQNQAICSATSE